MRIGAGLFASIYALGTVLHGLSTCGDYCDNKVVSGLINAVIFDRTVK